MAYADLREFMAQLEAAGELVRVGAVVDPKLEMTALCDRALRDGGPALLFENPAGSYRAPRSPSASRSARSRSPARAARSRSGSCSPGP